MSKVAAHYIYGYETKDTKLEQRNLIYSSSSYARCSDVFQLLLNLQLIEDVASCKHKASDGYALIHAALEELKMFGVSNVLDHYRFKQETFTLY